MAHLPNEIWLLIASFCEPKDLWISLRKVNRQLLQCSEQHFGDVVMSQAILSLPIALPTYDMRNPIQGRAAFRLAVNKRPKTTSAIGLRLRFELVETEPDYYRSHFCAIWASKMGRLNERTQWQLELHGPSEVAYLRQPAVEMTEDCTSSDALLSFEWRTTLASFYR